MIFWRVVVHNKCHAIDVNTSCRNIGCDKRLSSGCCEVVEGPSSLVLAATTVDGYRVDTELAELLLQSVTAVASPAEDDRWPLGGNCECGYFGAFCLVHLPEQVVCQRDVGR